MYGGSAMIQGGLSQHSNVLIGEKDINNIELLVLIEKSKLLINRAIPSVNPTNDELDYNHKDYKPIYSKYIKEAAFILADQKIEADAANRSKQFKINL